MGKTSPTHLRTLATAAALLGAPCCLCHAVGLKQAEFTRVVNDVRVMPIQQQPIPAKTGDKISGQTGVSTGASSRAELTFPDKTITRIGANSLFKLDKGERTVDLEKGVILLQVPKQIGGAKVRTAAVTAAVTGTTVMVEYDPIGAIKVIVLEGEVDVFLNDKPSVMRTLVAGDMLILPPDATSIPLPVKVDLELLKKTSKLMDTAEFGPLGNQKYLANALQEQQTDKNKGELLKTAFEIKGRGTQVSLTTQARNEFMRIVSARDHAPRTSPERIRSQQSTSIARNDPASVSTTSPGRIRSPRRTARALLNPGTSIFGVGSSIVTNPHATAFNSTAGGIITMEGTTYHPGTEARFDRYMYDVVPSGRQADDFVKRHGNWFAFKGDSLYISGDIVVNSAPGPRNLILGAVDDVVFSSTPPISGVASAATWNLPSSVDALVVSSQKGSITMNSNFGLVGAANQQDVLFYTSSRFGSVEINGVYGLTAGSFGVRLPNGNFEVHAGKEITILAAPIEAKNVRMTAGQSITVNALSTISARSSIRLTAGWGLNVINSSQLVSLSRTDPLSVVLTAQRGTLQVSLGQLEAANVEIIAMRGDNWLAGSNVSADVIKSRVLSTGGELWIRDSVLGRDPASASSLIRIYGEGTGGVRFSGDNTLNAVSTDIAGRSVTVDSGGIVRLSHPSAARVFADSHFYNDGAHGNFTDKAGTPAAVTKASFGSRPAY